MFGRLQTNRRDSWIIRIRAVASLGEDDINFGLPKSGWDCFASVLRAHFFSAPKAPGHLLGRPGCLFASEAEKAATAGEFSKFRNSSGPCIFVGNFNRITL